MKNKLIFLFDGGCPLCLRETNFLEKKDLSNQIAFVDINSKDYDPNLVFLPYLLLLCSPILCMPLS